MTLGASGRSPRAERGWNRDSSPFHEGEQRVQRRLGVREQVERAGRNMIRGQMPEQHRQLFEALPLIVVGSRDAQGRVWASLLAGEPGFVRSPSPELLQVHAQPIPGDPLTAQLAVGMPLGLLGIQLETRRRNRANGRIVSRDEQTFTLEVEQSFGNCKQYIQAREPRFDPARVGTSSAPRQEGPFLSEQSRALLERADTFFIATASAAPAAGDGAEGVDVSHRGGRPGFVRVQDGARATRLTIPDFTGNYLFNTFGNLEVNPRAGIVCPDFATGDVLSLTGSASVLWEGPELETFEGAQRLLTFELESALYFPHALPLRFHGFEPSREILETGTWAEAAEHAASRD